MDCKEISSPFTDVSLETSDNAALDVITKVSLLNKLPLKIAKIKKKNNNTNQIDCFTPLEAVFFIFNVVC